MSEPKDKGYKESSSQTLSVPTPSLTLTNSNHTTNLAMHDLLKFFSYEHLPEKLQHVSRPFAELAKFIETLPYNDESRTALRKLLEAKDCAVRAAL